MNIWLQQYRTVCVVNGIENINMGYSTFLCCNPYFLQLLFMCLLSCEVLSQSVYCSRGIIKTDVRLLRNIVLGMHVDSNQ